MGLGRAALRRAAGLSLLCGALASAWNMHAVLASLPAEALTEGARNTLRVAFEDAMASHATSAAIETRLLAALAEEPRNWLVIDALTDLAEARSFALSPALVTEISAARERDQGWFRSVGRCAACTLDLALCSLNEAVICRLPVELTPIADIRDLSIEGQKYVRDEPVDEIAVAFAAVGLGATVTGPGFAVLKTGVGIGRIMRRMRLLSSSLEQHVAASLKRSIDWNLLGRARSRADLNAAVDWAALRPVTGLAGDFGRIAAAVGTARTLHLSRAISSPAEARAMADAAEVLGPRAVGHLEILGRPRFLRLAARTADLGFQIAATLLALLGAIAALFWSALASLLARSLRRLARD